MSVIPFPIPPQHVLDLIREAARIGDVAFPDPPVGGEWYRVVTSRQVGRCLAEGELVGEPLPDEHGNVRCVLERFGCGLTVRVDLVLTTNDDGKSRRIIILGVGNRQ